MLRLPNIEFCQSIVFTYHIPTKFWPNYRLQRDVSKVSQHTDQRELSSTGLNCWSAEISQVAAHLCAWFRAYMIDTICLRSCSIGCAYLCAWIRTCSGIFVVFCLYKSTHINQVDGQADTYVLLHGYESIIDHAAWTDYCSCLRDTV